MCRRRKKLVMGVQKFKKGQLVFQSFTHCRLTTWTASYRRSEETGWPMEGQSSCSSITDFRPSAVQSATIQPQSRVLKGKPPWQKKNSFLSMPSKGIWSIFSTIFVRLFNNICACCVISVSPCSFVCSTSGTREDSQVSVRVEKSGIRNPFYQSSSDFTVLICSTPGCFQYWLKNTAKHFKPVEY